MTTRFSTGAFRLTLAVVCILLALDPTSSAPLALRINVPIDTRKQAFVHHRPAPLPIFQAIVPSQPTGTNDSDDAKGDGGHLGLKFRGQDLPRTFGAYDLDQSRGVSLLELAAATDTDLKDAMEPFMAADTNGDNILSPKEFTEAPWIFDAGGITLIDSVPEPSMDGPLETDKDPLP
ncbi:uncharacterized protein LOC117307296 [Asterias rubens]|uniref:uncharacterized protein LOC117307296 n=1 Tax=Asterias rubens TaxID=7604 RepID=UPI0014553FF2|nr:uncharacterized protein LOC117307296 [Asterias rubens]XP_033647905.1 uncharacterized protein LOC117307296 [Asterias rubens]